MVDCLSLTGITEISLFPEPRSIDAYHTVLHDTWLSSAGGLIWTTE